MTPPFKKKKKIDGVLKATDGLKFLMHFSIGTILNIAIRCQNRPMKYNLDYNLLKTRTAQKEL